MQKFYYTVTVKKFNSSNIWCGFVELQLVLANPGAEVMKKLNKSKFIETLGQEWMFLTVGEAVEACNFMLHSCKPISSEDGSQKWSNTV